MVARIHDVQYDPRTPDLPVESFSLESLRRRVSGDILERTERVDFNLVIICTDGAGVHEVDFSEVPLRPLTVVHVRPSQVHRWRFSGHYQARLILFPRMMDRTLSGWPVGPRTFPLSPERWQDAQLVLQLLEQAHSLNQNRDALTAIRDLLILAIGLDRDYQDAAGSLPAPYVAFRNQIEREPGWSRSVSARAARLGYSPRTLNRASQAATGKTAKEILDERLLLEARRLLAYSDRTIASISRELAFSEPTNFTKFFKRTSGETPDEWRARSQAG